MAFSEALKSQVRKRAHQRCCICHAWDVEVHHIIPQEEGGPDDEDNAAPLCGTCHNQFGGNPDKRKAIRETRDLWYEICANRFTSDSQQIEKAKADLLDEFRGLRQLVEQAVVSQKPVAEPTGPAEQSTDLESVKELVESLFNQVVNAHFSGIQHLEWLIDLDSKDARWPLLLAEEYVHFLKAYKGMTLMRVRVIETENKEVSHLAAAINLDQVERGIRELSKLCQIPEDMMQPIYDEIEYVRSAV